MRVSGWKTLGLTGCLIGLIVMAAAQQVVLHTQQRAIEALVKDAIVTLNVQTMHTKMVWDLHRRMLEQEKEDQRILAHVKWYIMARSGIRELTRLEAAMEKAEYERNAKGD